MKYFVPTFILSIFPAVMLYKALPFAGKNALVFVILMVLVFLPIKKLLSTGGYYPASTGYIIALSLAGLFLLATLYYQIPGFSALYKLPPEVVHWASMDNAYFISLALPFLIIFFLG